MCETCASPEPKSYLACVAAESLTRARRLKIRLIFDESTNAENLQADSVASPMQSNSVVCFKWVF